jgi:Asp-tRNA(Asn)/Glu-tRNA(Gln) amidotransferase B subunit
MRERSRLITAFSDRLGGWNQLDLLQKEIIKRLATMALNSQLAELEMFANPQKVTNENRLSFSTAQSNFDRLARSIGLIKDHKISVKDQKKIDAAAATANMRAYAAKANAEAAARGDTAAAKIIARVAAEDAAAAAKATAAKTTEVAEL